MQNLKQHQLTIKPIAYIESPFKQKFSIPRQASLSSLAKGKVVLIEPYNQPEALRMLENFSHIWLIFEFHQNPKTEFKPLVKPPRLGGKVKVGVFATRSPFRPNSLGLSKVKLDKVIAEKNNCYLEISGLDLLDNTPIYDIKPYIPYADQQSDASFGFNYCTQPLEVIYTLDQNSQKILDESNMQDFISQTLTQDPRSAWQKDHKIHKTTLDYLDITWQLNQFNQIEITAIEKIKT